MYNYLQLKISVRGECVLFGSFFGCEIGGLAGGVFADALLEKVGLALQGDHLHPFKRVLGIVNLVVAECRHEPK